MSRSDEVTWGDAEDGAFNSDGEGILGWYQDYTGDAATQQFR